jgi:hypothetical protein
MNDFEELAGKSENGEVMEIGQTTDYIDLEAIISKQVREQVKAALSNMDKDRLPESGPSAPKTLKDSLPESGTSAPQKLMDSLPESGTSTTKSLPTKTTKNLKRKSPGDAESAGPSKKPDLEIRADADEIDNFLDDGTDDEKEEKEDEEEKDDWLAEMATDLTPSDETGEDLASNVAEIGGKLLKNRQTDEKLKSVWDKYPRPGNMGMLKTPKTHELIFKKLPRETRWEEIQSVKLGDRLSKTLTGNMVLLNQINLLKTNCKDKETKKALKELARTSLETVQMGAATVHKLSDMRRYRMKNSLHDYKALCNTPEEETGDLLGGNIAEKMKEINEAAKMSRQLEGSSGNYKREQSYYPQSKRMTCVNDTHSQDITNGSLPTMLIVSRQRLQAGLPDGERQLQEGQRADTRTVSPRRELLVQTERKGELPGTRQKAVTGKEVNSHDNEDWEGFNTSTIAVATFNTNNFQAGTLRNHVEFWKSITSDPIIIGMILGTKIELEQDVIQTELPEPYNFPQSKMDKIDSEIKKLLSKGVIIKSDNYPPGYVSNIFTREKADGTLRLILDLSDFNNYVTYRHFKMENLASAINLMTENCYMASIDWKDAYYSVPIALAFQKYLRFEWDGQLYNYTCYPNGLSSAPRNFTKITKVLFSELRKQGHLSTNYIDDCLLLGSSKQVCKENVRATVQISENAGFVVHPDKSKLEPETKIEYLGFQLDSKRMTVRLTDSKAEKFKTAVGNVLGKKYLTIRQLSQIVGTMVASFPGVKYGQLFYRRCDNLKSKALKDSRGNFEAQICLPPECLSDLKWWAGNIREVENPIQKGKPKYTFECDASQQGWGGCLVTTGITKKTGGNWDRQERERHINYLELLATWLTIQSFCKGEKDCHIKVLSDNTTAVAYLNNMGGTKESCNDLAREIWSWCHENSNWITSAHLPGKLNIAADKESRSVHDNMEWKLNPDLFDSICDTWGKPDIDLFASRLNCQLSPYCSWKPDPGAMAVDALSIDWSPYFFYAFPPFNMIGRVLRKVEEDKAEGIIIFPAWPTQPWYPKLLQLCLHDPVTLYRKDATLSHPWRMEETLPKTRIQAAIVSARVSTA